MDVEDVHEDRDLALGSDEDATIGRTDQRQGRFELHLIPETLRLTNLDHKQPGDRVNVELDPRTVAIVDTVERVIAERGLVGKANPGD